MTRPFSAPFLALAAALLAGCVASTPGQEVLSQPDPKLPGRVVWTDGHGEIAVARPGQAQCPATSAAMGAAALASTNAQRAQSGQPPLRLNEALNRSAAAHACDMARRGTMTHAGSAASGPMARASAKGYRASFISENIAAGRFDLAGTLGQWGASPGHRANVTRPQARDFGIGMAVAADGKTTFWAAVYAQPR